MFFKPFADIYIKMFISTITGIGALKVIKNCHTCINKVLETVVGVMVQYEVVPSSF